MDLSLQLKIFELYATGMTPAGIAERTNVSRAEICRMTGHVHHEMSAQAKEEWDNRLTGGVRGLD